jgi:hypothetical protein
MREQEHDGRQGQGRYRWHHLKQDLGAVAGLLALLAILLGIVVLPGLVTDSASTVSARVAREVHR